MEDPRCECGHIQTMHTEAHLACFFMSCSCGAYNPFKSELHPLGNTKLRTAETFEKYHNNPKRTAPGCFICDGEAVAEWRFWKLISNDFPYDAVAQHHLLLVPIRHFARGHDMDFQEAEELMEIREQLERDRHFDAVIENLARGRTFPSHYHVHLIQWIRV